MRGRRGARDYAIVVEAVAALIAARAVTQLLPFGRIAERITPGLPGNSDPARARQVGWAIEAAARRLPIKALCFQQGLAAQAMLRRRSLMAALCYGARQGAGGLEAHVWVNSGSTPVTGWREAPDFQLIACFPPGDALPGEAPEGGARGRDKAAGATGTGQVGRDPPA